MRNEHNTGNTTNRSIKAYMAKRAFMRGFADDVETRWQWHYERGRLFAAVAPQIEAIKTNGRVTWEAHRAMARAINDGGII